MAMNQIKYVPTTSLKPHPLNAQIYSDGCDKELLDDIKERGVRTPIEVTRSLLIISGHRRLNAAQMLGLSEVPVIFSDVDENDPLAVEEALIKANIQRQKSQEQITREYKRLKVIKEERAKIRMLAGKSNPVLNLVQGIETGKSCDLAAKELGIGRENAEKSLKVVQQIDTLKQEGQLEEAEKLRETLNKKSVNAAYQQIKPKKEKPIDGQQETAHSWTEPKAEQPEEAKKQSERLGLIELGNQEKHIAEMRKAYSAFISGLDEDIYHKISILNPCLREIENWMDSVQGIQSESPSSGWYSLYDRLRLIKETENEEIKRLEGESNALLEKLKQYQDENISLAKKCATLEDEKKTLEARVLDHVKLTDAKPIQVAEIQEKEIFYSAKQKAKYWYEKKDNEWVIMKLWENGETSVQIILSSEEEAKKTMKRRITSNYLVKESEIGKAEPASQEAKPLISKQELDDLRKRNFDMGREIMDQKDIINNLKESLNPKAKDFQEQEAKIKKLNKENQAIYDEFDKIRDEYNDIRRVNKLLEAQNEMFKDDIANLKKSYGIEDYSVPE